MKMNPEILQKNFLLTGLLLLAVLLSGCDIFQTRTPEPPDEGGGAGFQQPDRPEQVIDNLQAAVADMNLANYMRNFVEDGQTEENFTFSPSSSALDNNPDIWQNWSRENESAYFSNLVSATQNLNGHSLTLSEEERVTLPDGGERITASYTITLIHNRSETGTPTVGSGNFLMDLVQDDNGLWYIQSWSDSAAGASFTWSDFKAEFLRE